MTGFCLGRLGPLLAWAAAACAMPLFAQAQDQAQQSPAAPASIAPTGVCALHVWPAPTTHTTFQGWTHAGAVDGARRGIKGYPDLRADVIDTAQQVRIMGEMDWKAISNDPALEVVIHPAPSGADNERARMTRLVPGSSPCYREVIITSSMVEAAAFSSRSVRILALLKTFNGDQPPTNFSSMTKAVIALPETVKDGDPVIDKATQAAFAEALRKFAVIQTFH